MTFPPEALLAAMAHCEAEYPREGCGVFVREASGRVSARPIANVAPTPRTNFVLEPKELLRVFSGPEPVVCVFHSHVDADAHFSKADRTLALADGEPVLPNVRHLVLSVRTKTVELRLFTWTGADFAEASVPMPASHQSRATSHPG
ncbi:MAG: M67 family metallopeptidase [Deltaproteobacteria bacterium]|nr:M67 family metallopeptidase [Deltaproteobacteria bacterium]